MRAPCWTAEGGGRDGVGSDCGGEVAEIFNEGMSVSQSGSLSVMIRVWSIVQRARAYLRTAAQGELATSICRWELRSCGCQTPSEVPIFSSALSRSGLLRWAS